MRDCMGRQQKERKAKDTDCNMLSATGSMTNIPKSKGHTIQQTEKLQEGVQIQCTCRMKSFKVEGPDGQFKAGEIVAAEPLKGHGYTWGISIFGEASFAEAR